MSAKERKAMERARWKERGRRDAHECSPRDDAHMTLQVGPWADWPSTATGRRTGTASALASVITNCNSASNTGDNSAIKRQEQRER